jgi:AraC-like DNA-binding protein
METSTVVSNWTRALVEYAFPSPDIQKEVLATAGLSIHEILKEDARVPYSASLKIWSLLETYAAKDDALGLHLAEQLDDSSLGVIGYFASASQTLSEAIQRVTEYHRLLKDPGELEVQSEGSMLTVIENPPHGVGIWPRHFTESVIAGYITFPRLWTQQPISAVQVSFQHPRPSSIVEHLRIFGCEPTFQSACNSISFSKETIGLSLVSGNPNLSRYLAVAADSQLASLPAKDQFLTSVEHAILGALPSGTPTITRIGRTLGMGARTLQRRLSDRGTRFQDIVDDVRQVAARNLLGNKQLNIAEISFLLGFSDASGFQRAYRRWTGHSPRCKDSFAGEQTAVFARLNDGLTLWEVHHKRLVLLAILSTYHTPSTGYAKNAVLKAPIGSCTITSNFNHHRRSDLGPSLLG